jgi:DMSO/TMAO reductase YedYZ heme-binding membrane subunit
MLTAHVVSSVGWLGAVAASLALGLAGLTSRDAETLRAVYLAMELIGWLVLVPLSLASLLTGLVQALGTRWGLFRHYWVVFKLVINVFAAAVLLLYMQTLGYLAGVAASAGSDLSELESPSAALHAGGALLLLLLAAMLSVYKPRGLTRYGQRRQHEQHAVSRS